MLLQQAHPLLRHRRPALSCGQHVAVRRPEADTAPSMLLVHVNSQNTTSAPTAVHNHHRHNRLRSGCSCQAACHVHNNGLSAYTSTCQTQQPLLPCTTHRLPTETSL